MSKKSNQQTGGTANRGSPGDRAGVNKGTPLRKVSIPGNYKVSPNSSNRGRGLK